MARDSSFCSSVDPPYQTLLKLNTFHTGVRYSTVVRAFAMDSWIDPSWGGPIELFLIPASAA